MKFSSLKEFNALDNETEINTNQNIKTQNEAIHEQADKGNRFKRAKKVFTYALNNKIRCIVMPSSNFFRK